MELKHFEENGFWGPLDALSPSEMEPIKLEVEKEFLRAQQAQKMSIPITRNRHLNWSVAAKLCSTQAMVSTVTKILGNDLILWRSNLFAIPKNTGLAWHRDEYLTLLSEPSQQISVHLAISESTEDNCVCLLPGTHKMKPAELIEMGLQKIEGTDKDVYGAPNYTRSSALAIEPVKMLLKPGQYFLLHPSIVHASSGRTTESANADNNNTGFTRWKPQFSNFSLPYSGRLALGIRITIPSVRVFSAAFKETLPRIDKCVLLSGSNQNGVNELGNWAGNLLTSCESKVNQK